ncbi:family 8 carbohydrate esterase [Cercophora scortea]|uniref:Pectinesterase n=1 Tax=Cercophora scortea TaxID=314031 RepID=A0AAE0IYT0_9PEZI|nr:family 8 carbohydrate esterase [Cercophora scortea]
MKLPLVSILPLVGTALAAGRTSAPSGCLTVAKSGSGYRTIQAAVDTLSTTSTTAQCIFINPGTYQEQVLVGARSAQLTIYGYTDDTAGYAGNQVTITSSKSQADGLSNDETATLRVKAANFRLYNVNVNNGHGKGSQAVALSAQAASGYYACAFTGFQDTLLAETGAQLYSRCLIQGATDFVFGQHAPAWFEQCDIRVLTASVGYITASGRSSSTDANYYVFNSCTIAAAAGNTVAAGAYYLGRPWRAYARVVVQKTSMTAVINAAGWRIWNTGDERTSNVLFGEFGNTGAGAAGTRASFASKLSAAVSIATVLGSGYAKAGYFDAAYLS